jgi:uncharacterized protein (TIGR01777 family)
MFLLIFQAPLLHGKEKEMKILIAGSHGLIGSAVTPYLIVCGHQVTCLVRHTPGPGEVWWDPDAGEIDASGLEGFDAAIQLASMPAAMRWTAKVKQKMIANRSATVRLLSESLAMCKHKPRVLICASGIGVYPPSNDDILTEDTVPWTSFLSHLDREGETATASAEEAGIRVVILRLPMVVGGTALQRLGFQGGDGQQWISWVGRDEVASIMEFVLRTESLTGPVNAVSPNPLHNAEFSAIAVKALGAKSGGSLPAFLVRLVLGEMGEEFLLTSRRVQPAKLLAAGYRFRFPNLEDALCHEKEVVNNELTPQAV